MPPSSGSEGLRIPRAAPRNAPGTAASARTTAGACVRPGAGLSSSRQVVRGAAAGAGRPASSASVRGTSIVSTFPVAGSMRTGSRSPVTPGRACVSSNVTNTPTRWAGPAAPSAASGRRVSVWRIRAPRLEPSAAPCTYEAPSSTASPGTPAVESSPASIRRSKPMAQR